MGSIGSRGSWVGFRGSGFWFTAVVLVTAIGCAARTPPPAAATTTTPSAPIAAASAEELPQGPGRQILMRACVSCHNLREVTKFKGFYTRPQWRDIVQTMVDYGAGVNEKEVEVLSDYLTEHLGRK